MKVGVSALCPGDHVFHRFVSDTERYALLAEFVRDGLARGEQVFYYAHRQKVPVVLAALASRGVAVTRPLEQERLVVGTASQSYLASGVFDAEETRRGWFRTIHRARERRYPAIRVAADMAWVLDDVPGAGDLLDYERGIATVFATKLVTGMCEFDARLFSEETLAAVAAVHDHRAVDA